MKIKDFRTIVMGTPWRNLTCLILELEDGTTGYGESRILCKTHTRFASVMDVRHHIVGHDVHDIEDLYRRFTLLDFGTADEIVMTGLAMLEMASWDCIGRLAKQPAYKLLGGKTRDVVSAYANGWYKVSRKSAYFAEAPKTVRAKGYRNIKFDPFGIGNLELTRRSLKKSIELIFVVHDAVGEEIEPIHLHKLSRFNRGTSPIRTNADAYSDLGLNKFKKDEWNN